MIKSTVIDLKNFFPEVQECSHSKTNSAKAFIPTFENKCWTFLRRKIVLAKEMLLEKTAITTIAFDLGFSSSQSFATAFKRLTYMTPSSYRKKNYRNKSDGCLFPASFHLHLFFRISLRFLNVIFR